ncbi:Predicted flavoprotein CzcO associated with the cation diffusion facilitator CzcD [Nocardioides scoriae]|uniref:Predicted flavoprotein CzcO associated with the cation diffusion facilitator CzcD n=1 Tax=Nocardioides scoriae TaxID=642780 RepID=A0A1H1LX50_9ACTN|nr:NAD(P)/FAD-dependent oxidoreductase [Nocardioides scoriae]SDR79093.1 Predicted flavoprotein CzcO associated with the cation diffusion facilitator CzcD [Nocardioides scoriae]
MRPPTDRPSIIVIGAGFGGIGTAVALRRAGYRDVTVLERGSSVGGVWRDNTYPGAACDVPSSLYSFSFAPHPGWPRRYSRQPEIRDYIERAARDHGVLDQVRLGVEVASAAYDEEASRWHLTTTAGEQVSCDVLVSAVGQLSRPSVPELPGSERFEGPAFHSAHWPEDLDLAGRRVAVLGTGASAIQFVPAIAPEAAHVTVFQRSAPYVVPKPDRAYTRVHRAAFRRVPALQAAARAAVMWVTERYNESLVDGTRLKRLVHLAWRAQLRLQVRDAELRRRLRPDHPLGCKRVLFSNDWYPALAREDVSLVTEPVVEVLPHGVRDAAGVEHAADVVVYGTGFAATEFLAPMQVTGVGGADLHERWRQGAHAYLGLCVPDFPNLFVVYGPNTNLGGSSIVNMIEAAADGVVTLLDRMRAGGASSVRVRPEVAAAFDAEVQDRLQRSVWASCSSWYREPTGRITTNWPGLVAEYQDRCARLDPAHFQLV